MAPRPVGARAQQDELASRLRGNSAERQHLEGAPARGASTGDEHRVGTRRRGRSDLRRYVREIERASIVYVHNVELRISYMSSSSLRSGLFSHYVGHMNSNHRTVQSFRGRKAKVIGLDVYSRVRGCAVLTLANIGYTIKIKPGSRSVIRLRGCSDGLFHDFGRHVLSNPAPAQLAE